MRRLSFWELCGHSLSAQVRLGSGVMLGDFSSKGYHVEKAFLAQAEVALIERYFLRCAQMRKKDMVIDKQVPGGLSLYSSPLLDAFLFRSLKLLRSTIDFTLPLDGSIITI